ncbi:AraC family transcriptional regulator [Spongiimicrobium salis]|uniref:AraC family transcriptional regulator n=1 Tax=Spongiimicrobium salis TaxID=1667022 RepID=UPI00374DC6B7
MNKELPEIPFKSSHPDVKDIEIITLEDLNARKHQLDHFPNKAHQLKFYMLVFYTQGETEQLIDFVWHKVKKNTLLYLSKGQINAFRFDPGVKGYIILFTERYFKEQLNKLPKNVIVRLFTPHLFTPLIQVPLASNVTSYFQFFHEEFYKKGGTFNKKNIIDALFTILFSKLEQLKQYQTQEIKESQLLQLFLKFQSLLKTDFTKSRNALFYAKEMHISYKHLNHICKESIGVTAKHYIDEFVILEAKRILVNSSMKSTEVSFFLGFEEPTNFVKYFKKFTGLTPNSFKKMYK